MNKLLELIRTLKAFTILIVENDFEYINDPDLLLGKLCLIAEKDKSQIIQDLENHGYKNFNLALKHFYENWGTINSHDNESLESMLPEYLGKYLEKLGFSDILDPVREALSSELEGDEDDILKSIFLKNGIFVNETVPKYVDLIENLRTIPECRLILMKNQPSPLQWDNFKIEIESSIVSTQSNFCLSIIDKSLGHGTNEGIDFIKQLIKDHKDNKNFNHICCLFTSNAVSKELDNYDDYFIQEISKNGQNTEQEMASVLAQCAFAEFFNSLRVKFKESAEKSLNIVLKNQNNIKYIINKSHEEGISPYDSIKYWNELAIRKYFDDREVKDFSFFGSLVSFFNQEYLNDHPNSSKVSNELRSLNTFELFDYNVNKKHLPIAPGDIWESEGSYYILVGQLCDILLRGANNKRKSKIGELFKINLSKGKAPNKFEISTENNKKIVVIDHFLRQGDTETEVIKIDISTPNIFFADLEILDLSMYNINGECEIDLDASLSDEINVLLPIKKDEYYNLLKEKYSKFNDAIFQSIITSYSSSIPLEFSKFSFTMNASQINHGIKRICRLKGRYFDSLYNSYLNNKGRVDLNLIENTVITTERKTIYYQIGSEEKQKFFFETVIYIQKDSCYIKKQELIVALPDHFHDLLDSFEEEIQFNKCSLAEINELANGDYEFKFKYRLDSKTLVTNNEVDYRSIFKNDHSLYEKKEFSLCSDADIKKPFKGNKISIEELISGIVVPESNEKIYFKNGILKIEQIGE